MTEINNNQEIIFVTGASRSGTTMLSRILGSHTAIFGLRETHFFGDLVSVMDSKNPISHKQAILLASTLFARQEKDIWCGAPSDMHVYRSKKLLSDNFCETKSALDVYAQVVGDLAYQAGKRIVCEQTPRNIFYANNLLESFPSAKIIHIVRDPRAVLASQKNRWKMRKQGAKNLPISETVRTWVNYHPITISKLWIRANQAAIVLKEHPRFKIVKFEDILANPEFAIRDICGFLDLHYEKEMQDIPVWGSSNVSHTDYGGITKSVQNQWEQMLRPSELAICEKYTSKFMEYFNYEKSGGHWLLRPLYQYAIYPLHALGVLLMNPKRAWIQLRAYLHPS